MISLEVMVNVVNLVNSILVLLEANGKLSLVVKCKETA